MKSVGKKLLLGIAIFYLLGVFGTSAWYLSMNWSDETAHSDLIGHAIQVSAVWPVYAVEMMVGP